MVLCVDVVMLDANKQIVGSFPAALCPPSLSGWIQHGTLPCAGGPGGTLNGYAILETTVQLADIRHRIDDRDALKRALQDALAPDRVFTHPADLIAYEYDGSVIAALPDLVVFPLSTDEVVEVVQAARRSPIRRTRRR